MIIVNSLIKVFIASPYTNGDKEENVKAQMVVADVLIRFKPDLFAPFIPLLYHYQNKEHPQPEEVWKAIDLTFLKGCDALLRLGSASAGADAEVHFAVHNHIPVFYTIPELIKWFDD